MLSRFYGEPHRYTPDYEKSSLDDAYKAVLNKIKIPKDSKILDLASGKGEQAFYLKNTFPDSTVIETDISPFAETKRNKQNINHFVRSDFNQLPFQSNSFDFIHFKDSIVHVQDLDLFLNGISYVLKRGGQILVTSYENTDERPFQRDGVSYFFRSENSILESFKSKGFKLLNKGKYTPKKSIIKRIGEKMTGNYHVTDWVDNERTYFLFSKE